jgi:hypothetical protein
LTWLPLKQDGKIFSGGQSIHATFR